MQDSSDQTHINSVATASKIRPFRRKAAIAAAVIVLAATTVVVAISASALAQSREDHWKKVDEAMKKGLPKTAIKHLEPIIAAALKDKDYDEAIKAIGKKIALEGNIQGNKPEEKITRIETAIAEAPAEMKPVLIAIQANWYWHYFQQNRWRLMQRTATAEAPGKDFRTWDLPRLFVEIDKKFTAALSSHEALKKIPIGQYDELLKKGTMPDSYRPTLYDFVAHNALAFYSTGEQAAARSQDAFDLIADSPIFSSASDFIAWKPKTTDEDAQTLKAIRLYQGLLSFHQDDDDPSAFIDTDLSRIRFGFNKAFGEEKNTRYKIALRRLADKWSEHQISARALYQVGKALQGEGKLVEAHAIASQGKKTFPNSVGGKMCHNLIIQIETKSANITTERVWNRPLPSIQVRYKNLTKVYFRVVKYNWMRLLSHKGYQIEELQRAAKSQILNAGPVVFKSEHELPATPDYQERVEEIPAPDDLAPGFYFLFSSHDPSFSAANNFVQATAIWVSYLALIMRSRAGSTKIEGLVLNAITGDPVEGAEVQAWNRKYNTPYRKVGTVKTDKNGLFSVTGTNQTYAVVLAKHDDQQVSTNSNIWTYSYDTRPKPYSRTVFFTDRSLYRPGQTIHFKGLCIAVNHQNDNYKALPGQKVTVVFRDRNNKEIARQLHRANDYGSFSGSFTAPRDSVTGYMSIRVDGSPTGSVGFSVEEYKRPKFKVTLDKPVQGTKLNGKVKLTGKATAYTGAAIGGAKVRYRVVRQVRYPYWWRWYYWYRTPSRGGSQEIAHGRAATANDGGFSIEFTAKPDLSVSESDEPIFHYQVFADVTDTTGETRSASNSVNVGYKALQATITVGGDSTWLTDEKAIEFSINTSTLDGKPQTAEGTIKIVEVKQPDKVVRRRLGGSYRPPWRKGQAPPKPDMSNSNSWPEGDIVKEQSFKTDANGRSKLSIKLATGVYRAIVETHDRFGKKVTARHQIEVLDPDAEKFTLKFPSRLAAPKWKLEPGSEFTGLWGSGYDQCRAFIEIEHRRKMLQAYWTDPKQTQVQIKQAVTEALRGGFTVHITVVRENRAYVESRRVDVPWTNKNLTIKWEHFVSKLEPAQKETWTAVIKGPDAEKAVAEMVCTLYDESLDAYKPHQWQNHFGVFRTDYSNRTSYFQNMMKPLRYVRGQWGRTGKGYQITYRSFPQDLIANFWGYQFRSKRKGLKQSMNAAPASAKSRMANRGNSDKGGDGEAKNERASAQGAQQSGPDLSKVAARTNLNETAFFFPHLTSGQDGEIRVQFSMPEALTKWKFMGFAHDTDLRAGFLQDSVVTAKELMVEPNPPRFLREGDELEFTVKVTNQSAAAQKGTVRLTLADARTLESVDAALGNTKTDLSFDVPSKESRSYSWRLKVPDDIGFLTYKAVGSSGRLSDGEQGYLPVLSRRVLVTESLPLPIRGKQTKSFKFSRLLDSKNSKTIKHQNVTVQMVSQPAWYAVMALPYLMEYPHQCTEQTFNRLYANSLARHIAGSDPKIRRIFDQWRGTKTLDSPLEKNQDLKSVMLEETPWLRQANNESRARRNVAILFDENRLNNETARLLRKLAEMQRADGGWPWFPGGPTSDYITLYITTGFGRMQHLGVDIDTASAVKALTRLDRWINEYYRKIVHKELNHLTPRVALYLYCRSFFLKDKAIPAGSKEAVDYFLGQARKFWLDLANRQSQAHLALALKRFGDPKTAKGIMASIKERSVSDEELGMFWRELELSWWWYRAPIETQAMMIEAFDEVMNDAAAVEDCKVWLLKQKQTQDWKTTKATADAIYGLLLRGNNLLSSDALVEVSLAGKTIKPEKIEAGTGFYQQRFVGQEISPNLGTIVVKKVDAGVSWGSVHWQYLEDIDKVTSFEGTPLKVYKRLYTRTYTKKGPVLKAVAGAVNVGDELVVRIELRVDRDMEYVHLKDHRGSGTEPINVLSRYRYQDGLGYYESTRDTASHFFIDYLPKGVYVFEYATHVVHRGRYQTGMATIQCMYAPEFNSHSESLELVVE